MHSLSHLIGIESSLPEVARAIHGVAESFELPVAGAYHVTCSDETEWECAEVFDKAVAERLLPALKPDHRAAFHTMNLGGRYEPGAIRVAEEHFALSDARRTTKIMVVKINSHVGVRSTPDGPAYGSLVRYGADSHCCGALAAMLEGAKGPALDDLRATFRDGGVDRIAMLCDRRVRASDRALLAAVTNAQLQAARAVDDITERRPAAATLFLVIPCVTINRPDDDTELVVGQFVVDATEDPAVVRYRGLGDVPLAYRLIQTKEGIVVEDHHWPEPLEPTEQHDAPAGRGLGDAPHGYRLDADDEGVDLNEDRARGWGL